MKFFEHLAAGVPVVATAIDALSPYSEVAALTASTPEAFAAAIEACLRGEAPPLERRLAVAGAHTYRSRTEAMLAELARIEGGWGLSVDGSSPERGHSVHEPAGASAGQLGCGGSLAAPQ